MFTLHVCFTFTFIIKLLIIKFLINKTKGKENKIIILQNSKISTDLRVKVINSLI